MDKQRKLTLTNYVDTKHRFMQILNRQEDLSMENAPTIRPAVFPRECSVIFGSTEAMGSPQSVSRVQ
jgi:hypothetical protein